MSKRAFVLAAIVGIALVDAARAVAYVAPHSWTGFYAGASRGRKGSRLRFSQARIETAASTSPG